MSTLMLPGKVPFKHKALSFIKKHPRIMEGTIGGAVGGGIGAAKGSAPGDNGEEKEKHDARSASGLCFSPDGEHIAYAIKMDNEWTIVVDGKPGELYSNIIAPPGRRVIFDSIDSFHYLVQEDNKIHLVEERIE